MVKSPSRPKRGAAPAALDDDDDLAFDLATPSGRGGDLDEDLVAPPRAGRGRRAAFDDDDDDFAPGRAGVSSNLVLAGLAGTMAAGLVGAWFMVAADPSAAPDPERPPHRDDRLDPGPAPYGGGAWPGPALTLCLPPDRGQKHLGLTAGIDQRGATRALTHQKGAILLKGRHREHTHRQAHGGPRSDITPREPHPARLAAQ
ncbi:hypothetical protein [Pararhodospirillum photometricum]|uniref:hypothetical protein n=1 Tax=Pararhodospirillum photometricum TaxID=1084 RepID=UPI0002F76F30|nr:hypothetical protein [Pararhodospirillum photometricum]